MSDGVLGPGAVIGVLGGGQLGRMLALAAARLGFGVHVYDPAPDAPAGQVAQRLTAAPYEDEAALAAFAADVDVVTFEFENIPAAALDLLEGLRPVRPGRRALAVSQDRLLEKQFLESLGLATAPHAQIDALSDLTVALGTVGTPSILKTRRFGYDGKGQIRISSRDQAVDAFAALRGAPAVLERVVPFTQEISVIVARSLTGAVVCYDPGENVHQAGILHTTTVPARLTRDQTADAVLLAGRIVNALDYIGVMGVELFVTADRLVVNEIAPRVHNSGHWTMNGCLIDQFEQHIRAIAGWPLGDGARHSDVEMLNLIGPDITRVAGLAQNPDVAVHLYGKAETRPGRKMGHANRLLGPALR